jgi:hypothetical protein
VARTKHAAAAKILSEVPTMTFIRAASAALNLTRFCPPRHSLTRK